MRQKNKTLTMKRGLPASGKSTSAVEELGAAKPGAVVRVNKDLLREMLHGGKWSPAAERQVVAARDAMIEMFLGMGVSVISDDTNLNPVHEQRLRELAAQSGAEFRVDDFSHVPVEVCVERDLKRAASVGEKVIRRMYEQYLKPAPEPLEQPDGPQAVIVDVDGTIALHQGRSPFAWDRVAEDLPNVPVVKLVKGLAEAGTRVVYMSGRDEVCRAATEQWIAEHVGVSGPLYMRPAGDSRKDAIVKRELFDAHIRGRFHVVAVLDDRDQVVAMWRDELGLACLQVAPGDF